MPSQKIPNSGQLDLAGLLPSQAIATFVEKPRVIIAGGYGTGKSVSLCTRMAYRMARTPFNRGIILRLHAADLRDSTMQVWDEVLPLSWLRKGGRVRTKGMERDILKNGSVITFGHIYDTQKHKQHIASLNVSDIAIDQAEEVQEDQYLKLIARTRFRAGISRSITMALNPAGHSWHWRRFYQGAKVLKGHPHPLLKDRPWIYLKENSIALQVATIENTPQLGGYLPKGFYEDMRTEFPPEYIARYLDCSFEDFEGKLYKAYNLESAHNIPPLSLTDLEQMDITEWGIGIDTGGQAPWGIVRVARDKWGRVFVYDEYYKANATIREIAQWIQRDPHWYEAIKVIDYENRPVMTELAQYNIACLPSRKKSKVANIGRVNSYFTSVPYIQHPITKKYGAPRLYITDECTWTKREHDRALWKQSDTGENKPDPHQPDHARDALEYILVQLPEPEKKLLPTKLDFLHQIDPSSASFWKACKKIDRRRKDSGSNLREAGTMLADTDAVLPELDREELDHVEAFYGW